MQKLFLERCRDVVRHRLRIRAGIGTSHLNDRVIDRRKIVDREFVVGGKSGHNHCERQQNGHHWPTDERTGQARAGDLDQLAARSVLRRCCRLRSGSTSILCSLRSFVFAIARPIMFVAAVHLFTGPFSSRPIHSSARWEGYTVSHPLLFQDPVQADQ